MYVVLEGIDTAGKSTQIMRLKEIFTNAIFTCEPGGSALGMKIREILLHTSLCQKAEMLLFLADRAEHFTKVIQPNLSQCIISDRSLISGIAYAKDFDYAVLESLNLFVMEHTLPNKVILLELDKDTLEYRLSQKGQDRIEQRGIAYLLELQERLKEVIARLNVESLIVNASLPQDSITAQITEFIHH